MAFWLFVGLVLLLILYVKEKNKNDKLTSSGRNVNQDLQWHNYILSFKDVVRTKAEKLLIQALLERKTADQLYETKPAKADQKTSATEAPITPTEATTQEPQAARKPIDGSLLLLYFGAFLLVASAGLFVALADFSGVLRTAILAITTATLYGGGYWIIKNQPKLKQAGVSFMGTAMVMAPLIGVAYFNLIAGSENGAIIWLATSVGCVALYAHALRVINHEVITYLLIGSFVSVIESSVLALEMPVYVYAWGAIVAALILQATGYVGKFSGAKSTPSRVSAELLVPLSALGSLLLLPEFGSLQFAITLVLGAGYYAINAWQFANLRSEYSVAAQLAFFGAILNVVFNIWESWEVLSYTLSGLTVAYGLAVLALKERFNSTYGLMTVGAVLGTGAILTGIFYPWALVVGLGAVTIFAICVWLKSNLEIAYVSAGALLILIPIVLGQYALEGKVDASEQIILLIPSAVLLLGINAATKQVRRLQEYSQTNAMLYIVMSSLLLLCSLFAGFGWVAATSAALAVSFVGLYQITKEDDWWLTACLMTLPPVLYSMFNFGTDDERFAWSVLAGLGVTIAMSLVSRLPFIRWFVTAFVLSAPIAVGGGGLGFEWDSGWYAGGYLLAMLGLIFGRAVARGKLLVSRKVAVSSYEKKASISFVYGYVAAAVLSVVVSLFDDLSQIITTAILGFLSLILVAVVRFIESRHEAVIILPILLQLTLLSGIRPDVDSEFQVAITAISSALLGIVSYAGTMRANSLESDIKQGLLLASLIGSYFGLTVVIVAGEAAVILPIALFLSGALTVFHNRHAKQSVREASIFILIAALLWQLYLLDVTNIHIHTHVLALALGGLAYWRYLRKEESEFNAYIATIFAVTTVPMVFAALIGYQDGLYGLLLIVQQAAFLVIGVLTGVKFFIKGGLWVALAAVLYQLRDLGWAFLAIVAIVVIAVAVYRLQKHSGD